MGKWRLAGWSSDRDLQKWHGPNVDCRLHWRLDCLGDMVSDGQTEWERKDQH